MPARTEVPAIAEERLIVAAGAAGPAVEGGDRAPAHPQAALDTAPVTTISPHVAVGRRTAGPALAALLLVLVAAAVATAALLAAR